jgi:hypothetical protein
LWNAHLLESDERIQTNNMSRPEMEEWTWRAEHLARLRSRKFLSEDEYSRRLDELRQEYGLKPLARSCASGD